MTYSKSLRVQAGKLRIELQCTSASDAIVYTVNTLQEAATAKGITLSSDVECGLPSVYADPTRVATNPHHSSR